MDDDDASLIYGSACTPGPAADSGVLIDAEAGKVSLRIATTLPLNSSFGQRLREASKIIEARTAGRVDIRFRFGGVDGDDDKVLKKVRTGLLQGALVPASALTGVYPDIGVLGLPLLFRTPDEVVHVRRHIDPALGAGLEEAGFVAFCIAGNGFSRFMSREPVRTLYDLRGSKAWVPDGDPITYAFFRALGGCSYRPEDAARGCRAGYTCQGACAAVAHGAGTPDAAPAPVPL